MDIITVLPRMPYKGESLTAVEPLVSCSGGKGANQAMAAYRLSRDNPAGADMAGYDDGNTWSEIEVLMVGCIGCDDYGKQILAAFDKVGLSTRAVKSVNTHHTGVAVILVESGTGESRVLLHPGANHALRPPNFTTLRSLTGSLEGEPLRKPDLLVLQLEIPRNTVEKIIETAKRESVEVLLNAAPALILLKASWQGVTHLIVNETEGAILHGKEMNDITGLGKNWSEFTNEFLRRGVKNVVVTLGAKGAYFSNKLDKGGFCLAQKVDVVDTTTAGDTFVGAYAVEVVTAKNRDDHWDIEKAVRRACRAATCTVMKKGTQDSIPWRDEVII